MTFNQVLTISGLENISIPHGNSAVGLEILDQFRPNRSLTILLTELEPESQPFLAQLTPQYILLIDGLRGQTQQKTPVLPKSTIPPNSNVTCVTFNESSSGIRISKSFSQWTQLILQKLTQMTKISGRSVIRISSKNPANILQEPALLKNDALGVTLPKQGFTIENPSIFYVFIKICILTYNSYMHNYKRIIINAYFQLYN